MKLPMPQDVAEAIHDWGCENSIANAAVQQEHDELERSLHKALLTAQTHELKLINIVGEHDRLSAMPETERVLRERCSAQLAMRHEEEMVSRLNSVIGGLESKMAELEARREQAVQRRLEEEHWAHWQQHEACRIVEAEAKWANELEQQALAKELARQRHEDQVEERRELEAKTRAEMEERRLRDDEMLRLDREAGREARFALERRSIEEEHRVLEEQHRSIIAERRKMEEDRIAAEVTTPPSLAHLRPSSDPPPALGDLGACGG